jgi:AAA family ATP:ADP antiporter
MSRPLAVPTRGRFTRLVDVKPGELRAVLWSAGYFFCVLASYFILRPIRDEAGVAGGIRNLPWLFTGTMIAMLIINPAFAALVARLSRRRFVTVAYRFFLVNLLIFYVLFKWLPAADQVWVGRAFYIWTSVFNLFVVSVFWGFMADGFKSEQGKRLFGFIGVGGTLGSIVGSAVTAGLVEAVGSAALLLISAALLEAAVLCVGRLSAAFAGTGAATSGTTVPGGAGSGTGTAGAAEAAIGGGVLAGIGRVFASPYLLGICAYMLLYTLGSTFLYFQQAYIVEAAYTDRAARTALFARIDLAVNVLTVLVQAFVTGKLMTRLGVAATLTIVPAISVVGFLGVGLVPSVAMLIGFLVLRRAGNFAVARPSREVLYTVVSREDKFKAKSFIDTFVYRLGDQLGAWADPLVASLGLGMAGTGLVAAPLAALWLVVGFWLGRRQAVMAGGTAARPAEALGSAA